MRPRLRWIVLAPLAAFAVLGVAVWALLPASPERLLERAEAASRAGEWGKALALWRSVNRTKLARGRTFLAEARACLALDRAAQAEQALRRSIAADPSDAEPWRLVLELFRVEDRVSEAQRLGWEAYAAVPIEARRGVLRDLTLALLADLPEDFARGLLDRWITADPSDIDAQVARLQRIAGLPRPGDPDRTARLAALTALLNRDADHLAAREALASAFADAGEPDHGREVLAAWPAGSRDDPRYLRLSGRWDLDYDRQPARAVEAFRRVLAELPHDWKTHYRLARALQRLGQSAEAARAAETVARLRELLDPATLGPRLGADLAHPDEAKSSVDLADFCARAGLSRLANAWRVEASASPSPADAAHSPMGIFEVPPSISDRIKPR